MHKLLAPLAMLLAAAVTSCAPPAAPTSTPTPTSREANAVTETGSAPPMQAQPASPKPNEERDLLATRRILGGVLRAEDRRLEDEALLAALVDADPAIRARAVIATARIAAPGAREKLERAASDAAAAVRAEAAFGLGLIADPRAAAVVAGLSRDEDPVVRARSADALGRLAAEGSSSALVSLLDDRAPSVRAEACLAAWKFADAGGFVEPLIARSSDVDPIVRFGAAYALGRLGASRSASPSSGARPGALDDQRFALVRAALIRLASAAESEIRMQAARGLSSPSGAAESAAVAALASDGEPGVRINALRAFGQPGFRPEPSIERAVRDSHPHVTRAAVEALAKMGTSEASQLLWDGVAKTKNLSVWLFEPAAVGFAQANPAELRNVVEGLASHPDPSARAAAPALLAGNKETWAREIVDRLARDPSARVQVAAIPVLAQRDGPISSILGDLVAASDPAVRGAIAESAGTRLAKPGISASATADAMAIVERIVESAVGDPIADARVAAIEAAARAGRLPSARAVLERALSNPDWVTRRRAADALREVFGEDRSAEVGPAADRPVEDYIAALEWAEKPRAAIVAVQRPGFRPGRFTIRLDTRNALLASRNFARLAESKFFAGLTVHRVVPNFVMQDGDPRGDGWGGPGYAIRDEFHPGHFWSGTLGMASSGPDTAGSQWFVTLSAQPHLDGRYTGFGQVIQNLSGVVDQILPGDRILGVLIYEGTGGETLPPL